MDVSSLGNYTAASRFAADGAVDETLRNEISKRRSLGSQVLVIPGGQRNMIMPPMPTDEMDQDGNPVQEFDQKTGFNSNLKI